MPVEIEEMNVDVAPVTQATGAPATASAPGPDETGRDRSVIALLAEQEWQRARLIAD